MMPVFFLGNHAAERGPCSSHEQHLVTGRSPLLFAAYITSVLEKKKETKAVSSAGDKKIYRSTLENSPSSKFFPPSSSAINWSKKASNKRGHSSPWTCYHNDQMSSRCHGGTGGGGVRGRRKVRLQNAADPKEYPYFAFKTGYSQDHRGL